MYLEKFSREAWRNLMLIKTSIQCPTMLFPSIIKYYTPSKQFHEVYKLNVIKHQSGNSDVQHKFKAILLRMHDGKSTLDDWKELTTQFTNRRNVTLAEFSDAICIMYQKSDIAEFNVNKLKLLNCLVALIKVIYTGGKKVILTWQKDSRLKSHA
ncbi:hypothetical protein C1646_773968 [Rhizophagus diaphanus]|nr:hypothetical protein C1646_773968 [Rhizophagus diaphanus] [Rhizophagus sp. MUCL 43196]